MSEEVGCEDFLQTVGGEPVLLRQDPLTGRKHADDAAAMGDDADGGSEGEMDGGIFKEQTNYQTYLEKRPLKKAFTSKCGSGMMPAFR